MEYTLNKFEDEDVEAKFSSRNIDAIHILYLRGDGQRIHRNSNAAALEKFWATYFYGPLWVAFSSDSLSGQLVSWTPEDLKYLPVTRSPENKLIRWLMDMDEFNRNLEDYQEKLSTYAFAMFRYKTSWCPKIGQKHDWAQWIYAHRLQDFRRPPDYYDYTPDDCCVIIHKDCSWEACREGVHCKYSHTTFERLYHPSKFKLVPCEKKVCNRADMCAFYHNSEEKDNAEQESDQFYDPFAEEYEEEAQNQEFEEECDSEEKSHEEKHPITNTNTNNYSQESGESDSATKPETKFPLPSTDDFTFEEGNEENVWANEEFSLEAALQKTDSRTQKVEFEANSPDHDSWTRIFGSEEKEPFKIEDEVKVQTQVTCKQDQQNERVMSEIKNIVLGNSQQMDTSKIVENIVSQAKCSSKSKFFDFREEKKEPEEDLLNDILKMDYSTFCQKNEDKPFCGDSIIGLTFQGPNSLNVIPEEKDVELVDSSKSISLMMQHQNA